MRELFFPDGSSQTSFLNHRPVISAAAHLNDATLLDNLAQREGVPGWGTFVRHLADMSYM